jgi:hypothetical protein
MVDKQLIYPLALHIRRLHELSRAPRSVSNRAWRIQVKFTCAVVAEPDENLWRIGPKERSHFSRHPHCIVHAQSLQSLKVKCPIIEIAVRAFFSVNTLSLAKHVPLHDGSPYFPAPHRAKYRIVIKCRGSIKCVGVKQDKRDNKSSSKTHSLSVMMPLDHISVNTIFSNMLATRLNR